MGPQKDNQENIEILLVDRNAEKCGKLIEGMLKMGSNKGVDYSVTAIKRIDKGLDYINNENPDLVIMGLANPLNSESNKGNYWGNTTDEKIEDDKYPGEILIRECMEKGLPFVVSSSHHETDAHYKTDVEKMLEKYGIKHFLQKPYNPESVVKTVEDALYNQPTPQSASTLS